MEEKETRIKIKPRVSANIGLQTNGQGVYENCFVGYSAWVRIFTYFWTTR